MNFNAFSQVDHNVTRHIPSELSDSGWDVLILHYLGLDHIGHLAGPRSPLMGPKIQEMDQVIETLHKSITAQVSEGSFEGMCKEQFGKASTSDRTINL